MKGLNKIRKLVIKQDEELRSFIYEFLNIENNKLGEEINIYDLKHKIEEYINNDEFEEAKEYLDSYKSDLGIEYYSMLGTVKLKENKLEEALDLFLEGLKLDEYNIDILYNMGYLNLILGNLEEAISFFDRCIDLTEDKSIKKEIELIKSNIIKQLPKKQHTFVIIGEFNEIDLYNNILNNKNNFIKINKKKDMKSPDLYIDDKNIKNYDIKSDDIKLIIEYIIRKNENVVLIFSDMYEFDNIKQFKDRVKLMYYKNINYYTDKKYFFERNINLFLEKYICNEVDFITTSDIVFYNYKKIVENRNNIYLLDKNITENMNLNNILYNDYIYSGIDIYINQKDEYEKQLYRLALILDNGNEVESLLIYLYDKYKTEDIYNILISVLMKKHKFEEILKLCSENKYCKEVYSSEMKYLYQNELYNLLSFIVYISIGNISLADIHSNDNIDYRLAILNFEGTKYTESYKIYKKLIKKEDSLLDSPLSNRNISYLKYINQEDDYKNYYKKYKNMIDV